MENMNTLEVYTILKKAKFTQLQSQELANLFGKYYETEPASRRDLNETELGLKQEIRDVHSEMKLELKNTELRLQKEIEGIRMETRNIELKLGKEIEGIRMETQNIRLEIQTVKVDLVRWMIGIVFGAAGLLGVFLKYVK